MDGLWAESPSGLTFPGCYYYFSTSTYAKGDAKFHYSLWPLMFISTLDECWSQRDSVGVNNEKSALILGFSDNMYPRDILIYPHFSVCSVPIPPHSHSINITAIMGIVAYSSGMLMADKNWRTSTLKDQKNVTPCTA